MSKSNFIYYGQEAYSKHFCESMIRVMDESSHIHFDGRFGVHGILDNKEISISLKHSDCGLLEPLYNAINEYKDLYPAIDKCVASWRLYNHCQLMRYEPGNYYYHEHCENDGPNGSESSNRLIAWMIFLNDIKEGGGTYFTHQDFTAEPRQGDLYIWPAYWTHMHKGVVAPKEYKYAITGWFNFLMNGE